MLFVRVAATRALFGRTSFGFSQEVQKKGSRLYTWGQNAYAVGREPNAFDRDTPQSVTEFDSSVMKVANGKKHALIMTENKSLYSMGDNSAYQLGRESSTQYPDVIPYFAKRGSDIKKFACGGYHNLVLTEGGNVLTWGSNNPNWLTFLFTGGNCLGLGPNVQWAKEPTVIEGLNDVASITAGSRFSLALKKDGRLFGWGCSARGQLLLQEHTVEKPQELVGVTKFLNKKHTHITKICSAGDVTVFLCDNGKLYTFGGNYEGQAGTRKHPLINESNINWEVTPVINELFKGQKVTEFALSPSSLIFKTNIGGVYYAGMGIAFKPALFPIHAETKRIFATDNSVGIITNDNRIYFLNDQLIEKSDRNPENKVFTSEDPSLEGDVQYIGGRHDMNYAIVS